MSNRSSSTASRGAQPEGAAGIRHPAWLFAVVTIPQALLLFLFGRDFQLLRGEIAPEDLIFWYTSLGTVAALCLGFTAYGAWTLTRSRSLNSAWFAPVALVCYIAFLYWFLYFIDELYPAGTPAWMVAPDSGLIYSLTFLSPALLYALILGVFALTPAGDSAAHNVLLNFAGVVLVPIGSYVALMMFMNVRVSGAGHIQDFLVPVFLIAATVAFLFLLIRAIVLLGRGKPGAVLSAPEFQIPFRAVIGGVFPILGLILNNHGELIDLRDMTHVFGDFDHPAFYIFAGLNGLALALPDRDEARCRAGLFLARLFLLPFSLYFCIVFLPYLPLALLAILFFGLGFLMLTPLVLTLVHIRVLIADYRYLGARSKRSPSLAGLPARSLLFAGLAALLIWPLAISASYFHERRTLHAALDYVYHPDHTRSRADLNLRALRKTLLEIRRYKSSAGTPYLGLYYQWLVLDNLTVSDAKIDAMQLLFFGETERPPEPDGLWGPRDRGPGLRGDLRPPSTYGRLEAVASQTRYDAESGLYRSSVDLTLGYPGWTNTSDAQTEYQTRFRLPVGARVTEYYLDIAGEREYGMLAEKKSALWIYNQITSFRQDPGLLYYSDPETLVLRVFPILRGERRTTGFEIAHLEPFDLDLEGRIVRLSAPGPRPEVIAFPEGVYISPTAKAQAAPGERRPHIHFVLDCASFEQERPVDAENRRYIAAMLDVLENDRVPGAMDPATLVCANFEYASRTVSSADRAKLRAALDGLRDEIPARGRFALGRTLRGLLVRFAQSADAARFFPVFIVLPGPGAETGSLPENEVGDLNWIAPETTAYYVYDLRRDEGQSAQGPASGNESWPRLYANDFQTRGISGPFARVRFAPTLRIDPADLNAAAANLPGLSDIDKNKQNRLTTPIVARRDAQASVVPSVGQVLDPQQSALGAGVARPNKKVAVDDMERAEQSTKRHASRATAAMLLAAAALERNHLLHPHRAERLRVPMVRASFRAHLLLQSTSFLSVETEAQKLALQRKQQQVLGGDSALDAGEEPVRMDEPGLLMLALLVCAVLLWRSRDRLRMIYSGCSRARFRRAT